MFSKNIKHLRVVIIFLSICVMLIGGNALAGIPDATYVTLVNGYLGVAIGTGGHWHVDPPGHFWDDDQPAGGRFDIWRTGGDPDVIIDDGMPLQFGYYGPPGPGDKWGAWQIMFDMLDTTGDTTTHIWQEFPRGITSGIWGDIDDSGDGVWAIVPYIPTNENLIKGVWYPTDGEDVLPIRCELEVRLMRDTVRFKWKIKNEDMFEHLVGLRSYADLMVSGEDSGTVDMRNIVAIPGHPLLENRTVLSGNDIPGAVDMVNSQTDPALTIRTTFKDQRATPPDKVGFDEWWGGIASPYWSYGITLSNLVPDPFNTWLYEPIPYHSIYDLGYGAFWKPKRLGAGQTMTVIHYIGLASASSDFTKPNIDRPQYVAAIQGPRAIRYYPDPIGLGELYPVPFTVSAYMEDLEKYMDLDNASFTITLPPGLELDPSENGKYTKILTRILAESEGSVSWKVVPVGNPTGIMRYTVSFSAAPTGSTTVGREINIPATEVQTLAKGWQMISVPFSLNNTDPISALGISDFNAVMWRYDPYLRQYKIADQLVPGEAYWLRLTAADTIQMMPGDYSPIAWAGTQGHQIPLQTGWNLIGNPYLYTVTLGELRFYYRDYGTLDYDQAVAKGLISRTVFWWDTVFRKYNWSSQRTVQFKPWQGYWLKSMRPGVTMIITPISQIGASLGGESTGDDGGGLPSSRIQIK